jgi:DUF4097 and DUF4098 domain-containing protein YvlB
MKFSVLLAAALMAAGVTAPAAAQDRIDQRRPTSATGVVEIHNTAGSVRVVGSARNEVRVTGTLGRGSARLEMEETGDRLLVRVVGAQSGRGASDIEVTLPARKTVNVRTTSADAQVDGVDGVVDVRTVSGNARVGGTPREVSTSTRSGNVQVQANTARVSANTVSGNVRVAGTVREAVEVNSVSGDLEIDAAAREVRVNTVSGDASVRNLTGRVSMVSVSGDMQVQGRRVSGSFRSVSGDIRIAGDLDPAGTLSLTTHSGDVELRLPANVAMELDFSTHSGSLSTAFPATTQGDWGRGRQQRLSLGRGGPTVTVRTFSGDLNLVRR